jgi:pimeloyl-ACP methyl ester carboxylesterase
VERTELRADGLRGWIRNSRPPDGPPVLLLHGGPGMAYTYLDGLAAEIGDGYLRS